MSDNSERWRRRLRTAMRRPMMRIRVRRAADRLAEDRARAELLSVRLAPAAEVVRSIVITSTESDRLRAFARAGSAPVDLVDAELAAIGVDEASARLDEVTVGIQELRSSIDSLPEMLPEEIR